MRTTDRLPIRFMLAASACVAAIAAGAASPLTVYGNLPAIEDMAMSPDGTKLAYVRTEGERRSVLIRQLGEPQPLGVFRVGDAKLRGIQWLDDGNLLITRSSTGGPPQGYGGRSMYEWYQLAIYSISRQALVDLDFHVHGNVVRSNAVYAPAVVRLVDGESTVFAYGYYGASRLMPALFQYSVARSQTTLIDKADEYRTGWVVGESGRVAAKFVFHDLAKKWELLVDRNGRMMEAASGQADIDIPSVLGLSADGESVIMEFIENGDPVWKPLRLKDASWGEPLGKGGAFETFIHAPKTGRIIGGIQISDGDYVFFDAELQAHWNAVLRAFPNERVRLLSRSDDDTKYLVTVFGAKDGYSYALFDWLTHRATVLAPVYEGLAEIAEVRRISYAAQDGLTIPGYLTLPPGRGEKRLPLIVLPHGGPGAADSQRFDWWAQALAVQGYAVLQPNYRGSTLNYKFMSAGFGEWGRKMQSDLSDGVRYLADQGTIDPRRVCIVGGSYGGYAALAGVSLTPDVYRCAISVAGIADMTRFRQGMGFTDTNGQRYMDRYFGTTHQGISSLSAISPVDHADAVTAPVLLIHGADDTVVPFWQSKLMESVLKSAHKNVELITLQHEDHWLSRSQTRLQMLDESARFLQKYNPAD